MNDGDTDAVPVACADAVRVRDGVREPVAVSDAESVDVGVALPEAVADSLVVAVGLSLGVTEPLLVAE